MTATLHKVEIGKEVLALCTKCKTETIHVITKITAGDIKKVYCKACNSTHAYKTTASVAAIKTTSSTRSSSPRRRRSTRWSTLVADIEDSQIVEYEISKDYSSVEAIRHKTFGVGVITKVLDINKIEVVFQDHKKTLAHNWE